MVDWWCLQEWWVSDCECVCVCICVCVCVCKRPLPYCARALHAKNIKETLTSNRVIFPTHMLQMYLQFPDAHVQYDERRAVTGTGRERDSQVSVKETHREHVLFF